MCLPASLSGKMTVIILGLEVNHYVEIETCNMQYRLCGLHSRPITRLLFAKIERKKNNVIDDNRDTSQRLRKKKKKKERYI